MPGCWQDWHGLEVMEVEEGLEGMGGGDCQKFSHARASGARRISVFLPSNPPAQVVRQGECVMRVWLQM